ncbi:MAG: ABC transporter permease [candidate division WOR-3 bacterium]|nr:ABC transporter permease [candidate division WOR-3 bacterium]MCR4423642.1 ABC transporter permease [candidate division WOR-3 bacterium]MDH7518981.1 ABC transporter permease [bacterium]
MSLWELGKLALTTFRTNRLRSFLTTLGIIIGVMTVIAIVSLIQGMNYEVERQISSLGSNVIYLQKINWGMGRIDWDEINRRPDLTLDDASAIARLPIVERVAALRNRTVNRLNYRNRKVTGIEMAGITPAYAATANYTIETGRFINSDDSMRKRPVCVIGGYIVDNLFPEEDPLGKRLNIEGKTFTIIGTLVRKGSFLGQTQDNVLFIPLSTFEKSFKPQGGFGAIAHSLAIVIEPKKGVPIEQAIDRIRELMRRRHSLGYDKPDDFGINTQETLREIYKNITRVAFIVMIAVAAISLLVGGIGIMNIMLVAVAERTREIGLRKALGATTRDILYQFLLESVFLALAGGAVGILLGIGIAKIVELTAHLRAAAPLWTILLGFGFAALVGIFFGIYPASRAARLDPIQALRYE